MQIRNPKEIFDAALSAGSAKAALTQTSWTRLIVLSVIAGAYISLGALLSIVAGFGFPEATASNPAMQRILSGLTFPIGLTLIVVLGGELFTGNNALLIPAYAAKRTSIADILKNWAIVWCGNFVGALAFLYLLVIIPDVIAADPWRAAVVKIAETKASLPWWSILLRGIGANWCVCLAVWLALSGKTLTEKTLGCWIPVAAFVILGYEHCIANMFFIPCGMALGADVSVTDLFANLLPATVGNIIGGALLVGGLHTYIHHTRQ